MTQIAFKFMKSRKMRDDFLQRDSRRVLELYVNSPPSPLRFLRSRQVVAVVAVLHRTLCFCSACDRAH
jgi:hypothetical protein